MPVTLWSGVGVAIQSALAAAKTITGITKANPGVVTAAAHGMANGDYVVMSVLGMHQLNGRVFRVANVTTNTYELEGENTTLYDTFSAAGSSQAITFGITMTTAAELSASGGEFEMVDTSVIHDQVRTQIPGVSSPAVYSFQSHWDVADAALVALEAASRLKTLCAVRFTFQNQQKVVFTGYVGCTLLPTGSAFDKVITPVTITMYGRAKTYTS